MLEPELPPQRARHPCKQASIQGRGLLTRLRASGRPVAELPMLGARILGWGSGLTTTKTLSFFLPLLLPCLVGDTKKDHRASSRAAGGEHLVPPSHLLAKEPAPQGPAPHIASLLHVEPHIVPPVLDGRSGRNAQVSNAHSPPHTGSTEGSPAGRLEQ